MKEYSDIWFESANPTPEDRQGRAEELRALSREVHDQVAHSVLSVLNDLQLLELRGEMSGAGSRESLSRAKRSTIDALERIRTLAARLRSVAGQVHRPSYDPSSFRGELRAKPDAKPAEPRVDATDNQPDVCGELFLVLREAVYNAVTHAGATRVAVDITLGEGRIKAVVEDDGDGFEPQLLSPVNSMGLASMGERMAGVGGMLDIDSRPFRGTRVTIEMPQADV